MVATGSVNSTRSARTWARDDARSLSSDAPQQVIALLKNSGVDIGPLGYGVAFDPARQAAVVSIVVQLRNPKSAAAKALVETIERLVTRADFKAIVGEVPVVVRLQGLARFES